MWRYKFNKYGNAKLDTPSGKFDSRLEYKHFLDLQMLQKAGKITRLNRQVRIKLGESEKCKVHYIADFAYFDFSLNKWVIADTKGLPTAEFKVKMKWLLDSYSGFVFRLIFKGKDELHEPFNENKAYMQDIIERHERGLNERK